MRLEAGVAPAPTGGTVERGRLKGLDALRGIAAIAVVLYHFTTGYPSVTGHPFRPFFAVPDGHYGVELFFIISGFVIFMTLERTRNWRDFLASRVARLWPAFMACLAVTAASRWFLDRSWAPPLPMSTVAVNLTMMPAVFHKPWADPSYWSLQYELIFYALAGTAFYLAGSRRTNALCLGWLAMALLARVAHRTLGIPADEYPIETFTAVRYASFFIIGIMLYRIRTNRGGWPAIVILGLAVASVQLKWSFRPISPVGFVLLIAGFTGLCWIATMERSPLVRLRPIIFLGDISYPLYVVHQLVGYMILERVSRFGLGVNASLFVALGIVMLLATAIHKLIEKPGQKALRRLLIRRPRTSVGVRTEAAPI